MPGGGSLESREAASDKLQNWSELICSHIRIGYSNTNVHFCVKQVRNEA